LLRGEDHYVTITNVFDLGSDGILEPVTAGL